MQPLDPTYVEALQNLIEQIRATDAYTQFLDSEEEEDYQALREMAEPVLHELHQLVAQQNPLQLESLEAAMLDPDLEGLFLPKILGFTVLRGEIDLQFKYKRPQEHYKRVLHAIASSANFDFIRKRVGQTIQIGFALSSDIWVTNLINQIENKKVRTFLLQQKQTRYRDLDEREKAFLMYQRQFRHEEYLSTDFPGSLQELNVLYTELKSFLKHRVRKQLDNTSLYPEIERFLNTSEFRNHVAWHDLLIMFAMFWDHEAKNKAMVQQMLTEARKEAGFKDHLFALIQEFHEFEIPMDAQSDGRFAAMLDKSIQDDVSKYFDLILLIHSKGYIHDDVIEAIKVFYPQYEGLSDVNECLRRTIFAYIARFVKGLGIQEYPDLFELSKIFPTYMGLFDNEHFNQDVKHLCMDYVNLLLQYYTDKRGKDYQDIKRFVSSFFLELNFVKEKDVVEMFKTRRKKKEEA